jgi:hypothetical protein
MPGAVHADGHGPARMRIVLEMLLCKLTGAQCKYTWPLQPLLGRAQSHALAAGKKGE